MERCCRRCRNSCSGSKHWDFTNQRCFQRKVGKVCDNHLVEKMTIRNAAKDHRKDCIWNVGLRGGHVPAEAFSLGLCKGTFQDSTYISVGTKFMLFISVLIELVPVACAALHASHGYVLVNSFQRQQYCPWIKQSNLFAKRSLMDGLDSLQKHSSPCLNSLKRFSTWEQNPEMGMAETAQKTDGPRLLFPFSASSVLQGDLTAKGGFGNSYPAQMPFPPSPWLLPSKLQGLETFWKVLWCLTGVTCPGFLHGFTYVSLN